MRTQHLLFLSLTLLLSHSTQQTMDLKDESITFKNFAGTIPQKIATLAYMLSNKSALEKHQISTPNTVLIYGLGGIGKTTLIRNLASLTNARFLHESAANIIDASLDKNLYTADEVVYEKIECNLECIFHKAQKQPLPEPETAIQFLFNENSEDETSEDENAEAIRFLFNENSEDENAEDITIIHIDNIEKLYDNKDLSDKRVHTLINELITSYNTSHNTMIFIGEMNNFPGHAILSKFDLPIAVLPPTADDRANILKLYIKKTNFPHENINFKKLGEMALGMSGKQLKTIVHITAAQAHQQKEKAITQEIFAAVIKDSITPCHAAAERELKQFNERKKFSFNGNNASHGML